MNKISKSVKNYYMKKNFQIKQENCLAFSYIAFF